MKMLHFTDRTSPHDDAVRSTSIVARNSRPALKDNEPSLVLGRSPGMIDHEDFDRRFLTLQLESELIGKRLAQGVKRRSRCSPGTSSPFMTRTYPERLTS